VSPSSSGVEITEQLPSLWATACYECFMKTRRILWVVAALGLSAGALSLTAAPAHAAALGTVTYNGTSVSPTTLNGQVGDTFTFNNTTGSNGSLRNAGGTVSIAGTSCTVTSSVPDCPIFANTSYTVTITQPGQIEFWTGALVGTITTGTGGGSSSSTSSSTSSPAPVVQQFGKPASGTCTDAAPADLNWGGASSGGWSESWAQWMNGGSGGAVCTRSLQYSAARGTWSVG
jgi:hypothetical protein